MILYRQYAVPRVSRFEAVPVRAGTGAGPARRGIVVGSTLSAICALALMLEPSSLVHAQEEALEEIMVTGSRIQRSGMETPTPVTMLDAADLQNMAPTMLIEALDQMPQFLNNATPETHDVYGGADNRLNLRGIGTNRTLVLLDGRRVVSSTRQGSTDISLFPEELMQRVEIVTGGASAAYGSDAVSGVVNMILDTDFTGIRGSVQGGITDRSDRRNYKLSLSAGTPIGERGHLLLSGQYFNADGVRGYEGRDWFRSWGSVPNPDPDGPARLLRPDVRLTNYSYGGIITGGPLAGTQFIDGGTPVPFFAGDVAGGGVQAGGSGVDPNADYHTLTPDQERGSLFAHLTYDLNDSISVFGQVLRGSNESVSGRFPEPLTGPWQLTIFSDNAFLDEDIAAYMQENDIDSFPMGRSLADVEADRLYGARNQMTSWTMGMDGEFNDVLLNAYYQYGRNRQTVDYGQGRIPRTDRLYRAIDSVRDEESGRIVCRSTLTNPDDGCVPMNIFGNGSPSQDSMQYVWTEGYHNQTVDQHFIEISGQSTPLTGWAGDIPVAAGVSYREDSFVHQYGPEEVASLRTPHDFEVGYRGLAAPYADTDGVFNRPDDVTAEPVLGRFNVWEAFAETVVPLLNGAPGAQNVELNLAARYADYSGSGGVWAWKAGLDWRLFDDLRLRVTRSRDTRAGTLAERFDRSVGGGNVDFDPLNPDAEPYLITMVMGGNPEIGPEEADTLTFGFVYQPSWFDGFGLSVDVYDIRIDNAISTLGTQPIIDQCHAGATALCDRITRDPDTSEIVRVENVFLNVTEARTRGIDFELSYRTALNLLGGDEHLTLRGFATHIREDSITNLGAPKVDRVGETAGHWGGDTVPRWQGMASVTYDNGPWRGFLQGRYVGSGKYDALWTTGVEIEDNRVGSAFYTNAQVTYGLSTMGGEYDLYFNVTNLFDRDPPVIAYASAHTGTTPSNQALFDHLGRRYTAGFRFRY